MDLPTMPRVCLVIAVAVAMAGCGSKPAEPPNPAPSTTSTLGTQTSTRTAPAASPTRRPTTSTGLPPACLGPVIYTIDGMDSADSPHTLCFQAGAILRVEKVSPGDVTGRPTDRVDCRWEAGISQCRFIRPGNATVQIGGQSPPRTVEVIIVA